VDGMGWNDARAYLFWWLALFGLWMLFVGAWNEVDAAAAALGAALAAAVAAIVRHDTKTPLSIPLERLRAGAAVPVVVLEDFALLSFELARSLVRRPTVRGGYVVRRFEPGPKATGGGTARRAWTVVLAGYSPNSYVVDIDRDRGVVLLHDLVPRRRSEEPA